jgi:hemerythrin-like domain-containing protein
VPPAFSDLVFALTELGRDPKFLGEKPAAIAEDDSVDPIDTLINEHGLIREFVDLLSRAVDEIAGGRRPAREFFERSLEFVRSFADGFHHFKEEHLMFVRLAQKQKGAIDGQIEALRYQHERGRSLVTAVADSLDGYQAGDATSTTVLLENVAAYSSLLRHHIHTEDHVFFPLARDSMNDADLAELEEEFAAELERHGADTFERCHKMVVDMKSILVHL